MNLTNLNKKLKNVFEELLGRDKYSNFERIVNERWDSDLHVIAYQGTTRKLLTDWGESDRMNDRVEEYIRENPGKPVGIWYHLAGDGIKASEPPVKIGYCTFVWQSWNPDHPAYDIPYPPEMWFTSEFLDVLDKQLFSVQIGQRRCSIVPGWRYPQFHDQGHSDKTRIQYTELIEATDAEGNPQMVEGRTWIWSLAMTAEMFKDGHDITKGRISTDEGWDQLNNCIRGRWMD